MTRDILKAVRKLYANYDYKLFNSYIYQWESDFFGISKSGYTIEVEVKQSRSDFKADFKKTDKHHLLTNHSKQAIVRTYGAFKPYLMKDKGETYDPDTFSFRQGDSSYICFSKPCDNIPNKYYYACPDGLIRLDEIPHYAGLLYYNHETKGITEIKKAPFLHKEKHETKLKHTLLQKYYWMTILQNNRAIELRNALKGHTDEHGEKLVNEFIRSRHFE